MQTSIRVESIEQKIFLIRGEKVMLDTDLAQLYEVTTKRLNEQVKRNFSRFPEDFMFQLTHDELIKINLRSQNATSNRGGRRYLPYAFTEQGIAMLSTVLNSERAIQVNIAIMRAFVKLRQVLAAHKELADRLNELEHRMDKKDNEIIALFEAIRQLMALPVGQAGLPPEKEKPFVGFHP